MELNNGQISVAVRVNGELHATDTELPGNAVFPIYSITKTLTAICVLRLAEIARLRLSDAAQQWLPELDLPATITLTQLLRHTSGLRDYGPLPAYHEAVRMHPERPWTRQDFLDAVLSNGLLFAPGASWSYSNVGYMLLIDIAERATGETFARLLQDLVVTPLALEQTSALEHVDDLMACVPGCGSEVTADGEIVDVRGRYHPGWCAPRVVASTAEDITRVFDELIVGNVLQADTLAQMLTLVPLSGTPHESIGAGMGIYSDRASGRGRNYSHGGGGPGYALGASVYPDTRRGRVSIAVFVNSSCGPRANDVEATVLARLLDDAFDFLHAPEEDRYTLRDGRPFDDAR